MMAKKFRGLGGRNYGGSKKGSNMGELLKQAQKAQEEMESLEDTFKTIEVAASAGGGAINVVATCDYRIKSIEVEPEIREEDYEIIQDLIIAGINEALAEVTKKRDEETARITGGLNLPDNIL
jgi:DNA-binding YbaB/EbfC family protein